MTGRLLLITEFARRARLPVSTLRYYDRLGLLRPAHVDPRTGYRRYDTGQLADAVTVARLRAIGARPDVIARVLAGGADRAAALDDERRRLTAEIRRRTEALAGLDRLAAAPADRSDVAQAVAPERAAVPERVRLPAVRVPVAEFTAAADALPAAIRRAVATLRTRLRTGGVPVTGWGALLPLDLGDDVTGRVFADLAPGVVAPEPAADLPAGGALRVVHDGPHDTLPHTYDALLSAATAPAPTVIERYAPRTEVLVII